MTWTPNRIEKQLSLAFSKLKNTQEIESFLRDLLTRSEINEFAKRLEIARLLKETQLSYKQIAEKIDCSTTTVTRVAKWLNKGKKGYQTILNRL